MSRIEELPDDFDESIDLNKPPTDPASLAQATDLLAHATASGETPFGIKEDRLKKDDGAPEMPPAMASVKSHTADEILDMMNKTPLFMTDISKADIGRVVVFLPRIGMGGVTADFGLLFVFRWRESGIRSYSRVTV